MLLNNKQNKMDRIINSSYEDYLRAEGANCYRLENNALSYLLKNDKVFLQNANEFCNGAFCKKNNNIKFNMVFIREKIKPLFNYFNINEIEIKKTTKKNHQSYYSIKKNVVFLNVFSIKNSENYSIYHIILHEIAHAITTTLIEEDSFHDSIFFHVLLLVLEQTSGLSLDLFYNKIFMIPDNYTIKKEMESSVSEQMNEQFFISELDKESLFLGYMSNTEIEKILENIKLKDNYKIVNGDDCFEFENIINVKEQYINYDYKDKIESLTIFNSKKSGKSFVVYKNEYKIDKKKKAQIKKYLSN